MVSRKATSFSLRILTELGLEDTEMKTTLDSWQVKRGICGLSCGGGSVV
jgi:hypothetical protein